MTSNEEIILERLKISEARDKQAGERMREAQRLMKIPFPLRIQEKGMEIYLQQTEEAQLWAFEKICKKDKIHKDDWKDEFALFWVGFLKGEYKSINQYLKRRNFKK